MNRLQVLQGNKTREQLGLEIGPYFAPLFPKKDGWNVRSLDVYDTESLIEKAKNDSTIGERYQDIEPVDYLFKGSLLQSVLGGLSAENAQRVVSGEGCFDYIASSHNFEHQPNPIQFLVDCSQLLKVGGSLTMAIPIGTRCFDRMRPLTTTGNMIDAYLSNARKPTTGQLVDHFLAVVSDSTSPTPVHHQYYRFEQLVMIYAHPASKWNPDFFAQMLAVRDSDLYVDVHCWVMNRNSLELILADLKKLGILPGLNISSSVDLGSEFIIDLIKLDGEHESAEDRCSLAADANHYYAADMIRLKPLTLVWDHPR